MSCIVDLSLESDDDDCYIYPSKRHPPPQKPLLKHAVHTPVAIRKPRPRPISFSSSSVISLLSPPRKPPVQARITSFFDSPTKKGKSIKLENTTIEQAFSRGVPPKPFRILPPVAISILFEKRDLFVDDDEAPMPNSFDAPSDAGAFESPMEIDSHPDPPVVVLSSSPPAFHRGTAYSRPEGVIVPGKMRTALKRDRPVKMLPSRRERPVQTMPPYRPPKIARIESRPKISGSGSMAPPTVLKMSFTPVKTEAAKTPKAKSNAGRSKTPASAGGLLAQTEPKARASVDTAVSTVPVRQVVNEAHSNGFKSEGQSDRLACRAHTDPDCNAIECISDFFDEYSPFHDTLPEDSVGSKVERPEMSKPVALTVPPVANVVDIRILKRQHTSLLLASDTLDPDIRRPYMSLISRQFLREVRTQPEVWRELFAGSDGCLIHVGFTPKECIILGSCIHTYLQNYPNGNTIFPGLCESGEPSEDLHCYLKAAFAGIDPSMIFERHIEYPMDRLPGRTKKDCVDFLVDATRVLPNPRDPFYRVDLTVGGEPKPPSRGVHRMLDELGSRPRLPVEASRERATYAMSLFQPVWRFENGASDILDIQWSSDGRNFGMASAAFSDGYNRAGNLMLGASDPWKVKMLFRHAFKVRHQEIGNLDKFKWATVSCVRFSNHGSLFYSGSYDGSVKIWNGRTGQWISNIPLNAEVVTMATSPVRDHLIAAATKDGSVHILRLNGGEFEKSDELHISKEDEKKQGLYASCLLFGNKRKPSWLIAGYDTNDSQAHGGFVIFDVEVGKTVFGVAKNGKRTYNTSHFDIAMHEEGTTLVTASFQRPNKAHSPGIHAALRVFDIRQMSNPMLLKSPQKDINRVTISPCQDYITSSGTGGSTLVWDLRNPRTVLTELKHNETKLPVGLNTDLELEDTGVTFAQWGPYHRFYTGSSDGIVKEWDITASQPFIRDIAKVDTQIMSAAFSPSWDELIVGECSGTATLFSTRGDEGGVPGKVEVDWTEDPNMMSPYDEMPIADVVEGHTEEDPTPVEDSGVRLARQLVTEGKIWIRQGYAWAVDDETDDEMVI